MKSFAFLLSLQSLSHCTGFSPVKSPPHVSNPSRSALYATNVDGRKLDFQHKAASIAATLALGWAVGASSSLAAPTSSNDWTPASSGGGSSSFVVALSDSDFADFSLPSYQDVSAAEINTNLKGGKQLFGEAVIAASSSSSDAAASEPAAAQKKEPSAADLKAEKADAKAAQKAARERQQAAVEAAAAAIH
eukprot:scaffold255728_cov51-Attheya_sp.AAC.1